MTRVALYARYSSDQQREASIEDQLRVCRLYAGKQGWTVVDSYQDRAVSGASLIRPGIQALLGDALRAGFDVVLAEALDRISRDQEDVAGVFKRMAFAGVKIITLCATGRGSTVRGCARQTPGQVVSSRNRSMTSLTRPVWVSGDM